MPDVITLADYSGRQPAELGEVREAATKAVLTVPGVSRIEPGLRQAVRNLRRVVRNRETVTGTVQLTAGETITATVDISTTDLRPAYDTAQEVRTVLAAVISDHGHRPGTITVAVLDLHSDS